MTKKQTSVLILEDHAIYTDFYSLVIQDLYQNVVVESVTTITEATRRLKEKVFDVVFVDILLGQIGTNTIELGDGFARVVRENYPNAKLVLATYINDYCRIYELQSRLSPDVFLIKSDFNASEFREAMQALFEGRTYCSKTVEELKRKERGFCDLHVDATLEHFRVLLYLKEGYTNKQIANVLKCSERRVNDLKKEIRDVLQISVNENIIGAANMAGMI